MSKEKSGALDICNVENFLDVYLAEKENIRLCHYCMSPLPDDCEYICPACKWLETQEESYNNDDEEE